jgi:hypothetical protein
MNKYQIRKFFGLIALYSLIILGIFAVQFRNELSINQSFGKTKLHLAEVITDENKSILKNSFQVNTSGITLFCNDSNPVKLSFTDGTIHNLEIISWTQQSKSAFTIDFTENTHLHFSTMDSGKNIFSISADMPKNGRRITIPYKSGGAYTVTDYKTTRALFNSQSASYVLKAQNIAAQTFSLTASNNVAYYEEYTESNKFSFDSILNYQLAKNEELTKSIDTLKTQILTNYPLQKDSITSELAISAWVAENASRGNFKKAVDEVPNWFKEGSSRTYLTTPYFNSLKQMNKTLNMQLENISYSMMNSISKQTLDTFEIDNFSDFLMTKNDLTCKQMLSIPSSIENFDPTISQAAGILHVYNDLHSVKPVSAALLESILPVCLQKIETSCVLQDQTVTIVEKNEPISMLLNVKAGFELIRFGKLANQKNLIAGGTLIVTSALNANPISDMRTLGELYKILCAGTNTFYPHMQILAKADTTPVWAWTCAKSITYSTDTTGTITLNCTFSQGDSHYMIINGIKPFSSIEIYGLKFRTDPRFEWYNSSGYAFEEETNTLFLKYRQKSATEVVRLFYESQN